MSRDEQKSRGKLFTGAVSVGFDVVLSGAAVGKVNGGPADVYRSFPRGVLFYHRFFARGMDATPLFDPEYLPIIAGTLLGFALLAALLLVPIWRFLDREEEVAEKWTPEALAERMRERPESATNGEGRGEETSEDGSSPLKSSDM